MKNPCTPTCPERTATCHATCGRYALYEAWCRAKRKEREKAMRDMYRSQSAIHNEWRNLRKGKRGK